jgi:hypothetical protein
LRLTLAALALACLIAAPSAAGVWARDRAGVCREMWTPRDLVRGPIAIVNGVLRPLTSLTGGVWFAAAQCRHRPRCLVAGPLWAVGSTLWGLGEGVYWLATGVLDTPSLGVLPFSPYDASLLQLAPTVPFVSSHEPSQAEERCDP